MEPRLPKQTKFSVDEKEWLETLRQLLAENEPRTLWVCLRSAVATLLATPFQVQLDGRTIRLLLSPSRDAHTGEIEWILDLPMPDYVWYEKRRDEQRGFRLSVIYRMNRDGDPLTPYHWFAEIVLATSKEFLSVSDSESRVQ
jgi:hypothetical protein